jgi:GNAT superfamily N-acetyltransferase
LDLSGQAIQENLSEDELEDSFYIDGIACRPDFQGKGYGGALLDTATDMVLFPSWFSVRFVYQDGRPMLKAERHGSYPAIFSIQLSTTLMASLELQISS